MTTHAGGATLTVCAREWKAQPCPVHRTAPHVSGASVKTYAESYVRPGGLSAGGAVSPGCLQYWKENYGTDVVDIDRVSPGDILYTVEDSHSFETGANYGRISVCVKGVDKESEYPILAHGQIRYRPEDLIDARPDDGTYQRFGEGFRDMIEGATRA